MKEETPITKEMTNLIIKICFDVVAFSKLCDQSDPKFFRSNEDIKKGLKWFIETEDAQDMFNNIEEYIKSVKRALSIYNGLDSTITNKKELTSILTDLQSHLVELKKEVFKNQSGC